MAASEFVPGQAAVIEDIVVAEEDAVGQPVVAHELPDGFDRVEFGTLGREGDEREIAGDVELAGRMPTRPIEKQDGVAPGRNVLGDFIEMQLHRLGVALRQQSGRPRCLLSGRSPRRCRSRRCAGQLGAAEGRVPRFAQRLVILFFWPTRASSANQISTAAGSTPLSRAIFSRRAGKSLWNGPPLLPAS